MSDVPFADAALNLNPETDEKTSNAEKRMATAGGPLGRSRNASLNGTERLLLFFFSFFETYFLSLGFFFLLLFFSRVG